MNPERDRQAPLIGIRVSVFAFFPWLSVFIREPAQMNWPERRPVVHRSFAVIFCFLSLHQDHPDQVPTLPEVICHV